MRGAWIEIRQRQYTLSRIARRSPCGERGLKFHIVCTLSDGLQSLPVRGAWIEISHRVHFVGRVTVAPRAGSVD